MHLLHASIPDLVMGRAFVRQSLLDVQVQVGGCTQILSYLGRLMVGKLELEVDLSHFNLVTVPFEVTYLRFVSPLVKAQSVLADHDAVVFAPTKNGCCTITVTLQDSTSTTISYATCGRYAPFL